MQAVALPSAPAGSRTWPGIVVTAVPVLFLAFDCFIKLTNIEPVRESFARLGYAADIGPAIGLLQLACLMTYLAPKTTVLGAVLMSGYLGGAVATHVRVDDPLLTHTLFPVYVGLLLWAGLMLRDERLRALLPTRKPVA